MQSLTLINNTARLGDAYHCCNDPVSQLVLTHEDGRGWITDRVNGDGVYKLRGLFGLAVQCMHCLSAQALFANILCRMPLNGAVT